jgi:hypothetical protein
MINSNRNSNEKQTPASPKRGTGACGETPVDNLQQKFINGDICLECGGQHRVMEQILAKAEENTEKCPSCEKTLDEIDVIWTKDWEKMKETLICPCGYERLLFQK